jgi:ribosome-associated translation inhibitor RaiA
MARRAQTKMKRKTKTNVGVKKRAKTARALTRKPQRAKRSPAPKQAASKAKRPVAIEAVLIPTYIRSVEGELDAENRAYIRRKIGRRLGKFADSIERVSVRTEDMNGPRGGVDRLCRIKVTLGGLPAVVFEARNAKLNAAVDAAIAGVATAVRRSVQRRRAMPRRKKNA